MKRLFKKSLSFVLCLCMSLSMGIVVHAEDVPTQVFLGATRCNNIPYTYYEGGDWQYEYTFYRAAPYYFIAPETGYYTFKADGSYLGCCSGSFKSAHNIYLLNNNYDCCVYYLQKNERCDFSFNGEPEYTEGVSAYSLKITKFDDSFSHAGYYFNLSKSEAYLEKSNGTNKIKDEVLNLPVTRIKEYAYYNSSIETVTIPSSVKTIDEYAFASCVKLKKVIIENPSCVYYKNSFFNCREDLVIKGGTPSYKGKKPVVSNISRKRKGFKVKWKKVKGVSGYQLQYATDKKFKKNKKSVMIKGAKKTSRSVSNLKPKKKYYVRLRTYKTYSGKKYYSKWNTVKTIKTK